MKIRKCTTGMLLVPFALAIGGMGSKDCWAGSDEKVDAIKEQMAHLKHGAKRDARPNFVTIVLDDMGFSDLRAFGSELETPNMDQLAKDGIMLTNFYAAPTSTPSRAMLFTGKDSHAAGVGIMASMDPKREQLQPDGKTPLPEYQGRLSLDVPPFPELLQQNGYYTMFTGKWDLSEKAGGPSSEDVKAWEIQEHDPIFRGFSTTRAALVLGGGNHYSLEDGTPWETQQLSTMDSPVYTPNLLYTENGFGIKKFPKEFYSTDYYTEMGINMLKNRDKSKPFYLCMTYTAPHNPLQAPQDVIRKYEGTYSKGWDEIRKERFERQKKLGLWPQDAVLPPLPPPAKKTAAEGNRKWSSLSEEQQKISAKKMAVSAAMIAILDENIGQLISALKECGVYENTVIFLYSDNGGANQIFLSNDLKQLYNMNPSYDEIGNRNTYLDTDTEWAYTKNTPFTALKGSTNEGGWHTLAMLHYPKSTASVAGKKSRRITSVMDIAPTMLELAKISYPATYKDKPNKPMSGVSMADMFKGKLEGADRFVAFEMNGNIGVRSGDWKLVKECGKDSAQLFNLKDDPFELKPLSNPEKLKELKEIYAKYAEDNKIVALSSCKPL